VPSPADGFDQSTDPLLERNAPRKPPDSTEPNVNFTGLGSKPSAKGRLTPLQRRGRMLVERLRTGGKEPARKVETLPDPRIGIALGGGSARGLTHIPYIEAMDELGLAPSVIAGTSIGALIGSGWAAGMTGAELREHSISVLGTMRIIMGKLWTTQVRGLTGIFQNGIPMQLDAGLIVEAFTPHPFPEEFSALKIPLYIVATDYHSWHQAVFNEGPLKPAIAGSIAIPSFFKPVAFANHLLVDGGVVNPLPLDQASVDSDILVGIDVNGDPAEAIRNGAPPRALDAWFGAAQIMMHSLTAHMMAAYPPDIYMRPHVTPFGMMEFWRVKEIIEHGDADKERFKQALTEKLEAFTAAQQRTLSTIRPIAPRQARK